MHERLPDKRVGDILSAARINSLSRMAGRFGSTKPGSNLMGHHGGANSFIAGPAQWVQVIIKITEVLADDQYKGSMRFFDPSAGGDTPEQWTEADGSDWELDASAFDFTLAINDSVVAYWDSQRGKFIPMISPPGGGAKSYKVTTFPVWDEDAVELFVRAFLTADLDTLDSTGSDGSAPGEENSDSPQLETDDLVDGEVEGDVVIFLPSVPVVDRRAPSNVNSIRPGLRIWAISNNSRLEMVSFPSSENEWFASRGGGNNIPAYSPCFQTDSRASQMLTTGSIPHTHQVQIIRTQPLGNLPLISGSWGVGFNLGSDPDAEFANRTLSTLALAKPAWARIDQTTFRSGEIQPKRGDMYGAPGRGGTLFVLYPGLPGFVIMATDGFNPVKLLPDGGFILPVLSIPGQQIAFAKARSDWSDSSGARIPFVKCWPVLGVTSSGGVLSDVFPYDGSAATPDGLGTMPELNISIWLPRNGSERDPNVLEGNIIMYKTAGPNIEEGALAGGVPPEMPEDSTGLNNFIAAGDYLDDKIGTIKFWKLATGAIPQGWKEVRPSGPGDAFVRATGAFSNPSAVTITTGGGAGVIDMIAIERFE